MAEVCPLSPKNSRSRSGRNAAPEKRENGRYPSPSCANTFRVNKRRRGRNANRRSRTALELEFVSPLSSLSRRRTCPAEICFPPFRLSKPSGQNYLRLDAWQWVCRQRQGRFAGQRFSLAGERICGGSLITFCSAALTTKSEFSSSAITIDIHLLDPDVDRSMAEYEECRLSGLGF